MLDSDMSAAWRAAATHLGIRAIAPYSVTLVNGATVEVEAFLPDFGGPQGTVVVPIGDESRCRLVAGTKHFVSRLAATYGRFDKTLFQETLDDWAWYGPLEGRPAWYTGKPWS
jgi:protein-L-isoaspartate O-methyltransferase